MWPATDVDGGREPALPFAGVDHTPTTCSPSSGITTRAQLADANGATMTESAPRINFADLPHPPHGLELRHLRYPWQGAAR